MSKQCPVDIISDSDSDFYENPSPLNDAVDLTTPPPPFPQSKKLRTEFSPSPSKSTVFILDDDPSPLTTNQFSTKSSTPSYVAETPFSDASIVKCSARTFSPRGLATEERVVADTPMADLSGKVSIFKCKKRVSDREQAHPLISNRSSAESDGLICVGSDNELEGIGGFGAWKHNETVLAVKSVESNLEFRSFESSFSLKTGTATESSKKLFMGSEDETQSFDGYSQPCSLEDDVTLICSGVGGDKLEPLGHSPNRCNTRGNGNKKSKVDEAIKSKKISKEERILLMEGKKQQREREKMLKAASKAEAAELRKQEKEMQKWEKGKFAVKSIVAEIDRRVVELGPIGGNLITRFAEKGLVYRINSNPIERSIIWNMAIPEEISKTSSEQIEVSYVLIIYEAEEFCRVVLDGSLMDHVHTVQRRYPQHTVCYLTNRLMSYINKKEQAHYKNPANSTWKRPAIEEVLSKLATHYFGVHSRMCVDEAELAEHVVGLTCSLASCQFRKKLTRLSVNANGTAIPKDCVDKNLIKKNLWLKVLVSIPKVQPRFAIAIWKKYPTMKSLLSVYMDPTKSVHEKEFLLKDLKLEGLFGDDRRLGEVCSKRMYRVLMAESGSILTDEVENGADFFND